MTIVAHDRPIDLGITIRSEEAEMQADWTVPLSPRGVILILNGAGNSRYSRRSRALAHRLYDEGFATLIVDLLSSAEELEDALTGSLRLDIDLLAERTATVTRWVKRESDVAGLPVGYLGSGATAAAALVSAARGSGDVNAIVSIGGRPDLAGISLHKVETPTLLIVGAADIQGIELNRWALRRLNSVRSMVTVPGATHRFAEPGTLEEAARLAINWYRRTMPHAEFSSRRPSSLFSTNWTDRRSHGLGHTPGL